MDDNTQQAQPTDQMPVDMPSAQPGMDPAMASLNDVAGMTPPPPAPVMPSDSGARPVDAANVSTGDVPADDYSYAEDVLNEILDSLDRIEAKLDAMQKKQG